MLLGGPRCPYSPVVTTRESEMKKPKKQRKIVELVKSTYQPTKAEKEEEFSLDIPGRTIAERMSQLAKAVKGPIKPRWIAKPRNRR